MTVTTRLLTRFGPRSLGTRLETAKLISDFSTDQSEMLTNGLDADGTQQTNHFQASTDSPTSLRAGPSATPLKHSNTLSQAILYQSCASNGLIS
jgi:hypothetical protein